MKYDDASWHTDDESPEDLDPQAGGTHIGMFLAWALIRGLGGNLHVTDFADEYKKLVNKQLTPGKYLFLTCDGKLTDEDLNEEGNQFAGYYYEKEGMGGYIADYAGAFPGIQTLYEVPDNWSSFASISLVIDRRLAEWRNGTS